MIEFTKPLYLLLLIPLAYYTFVLAKRSLADLSRFRSTAAIVLRLVILSALILALAGARMVKTVNEQCVVFVMDVSDSISEEEKHRALDYINASLKSRKRNQTAGIVAFGGTASVELAPCELRKLDKIYSVPGAARTDIAQALGLALASFPAQSAKKIVLLSDGNENSGKAIEQALLAGADDVSIDVVPVGGETESEVLLDKIVCPTAVKIGEPFDLKVVAVSKQRCSGKLTILRGGNPVAARNFDLAKGKSVITFQQSIPKAGSYQFKAVLECDDDTRVENNVALGYADVKGKPKVLYLEGDPDSSRWLENALEASDIDVDVRGREGIPTTPAQLRGCDLIVLSDIPAWSFSAEQMEMLKSGVRDMGIGLVMIGGENSFGAGGYYDTPIEEALPVDMSVRKKKVMPSLSVVIVMDKSGSMAMPEGGRTKIEMANDAAAAVVKLLQPIDQVAVVVCHTQPVVAVDLQPAKDKNPIYDQIATIRAEGGGISVYPSMKTADDIMTTSKTRQKHVILLADGADCDSQEGVIPLVRHMAQQKVTVSSVAFGEGKDVPFLRAVASVGQGNYYLARRAADLKALFTKDVLSITRSLIVEEPFVPRIDQASAELRGIDPDSVPPLLGYVATSAKSTARVAALSHKKDPLLAVWNYGLGRSAAFTSDCKPRWAARWIDWPGYGKVWAQTLRSTMRTSASQDYQTLVDIESGLGTVTIDAVDAQGNFLNFLEFEGSVVTPGFSTRPLSIEQTAPGRYESKFDAQEVGSYVISVRRTGKNETEQTAGDAPQTGVVSIPYPTEYKEVGRNTPLLETLAAETSGAFDPKQGDAFSGQFRAAKSHVELWRILVLAAVFVLPLDVAVRRLAIGPRQVAEAWGSIRAKNAEWVSGRRARRRAARVPQREATVGELLRSKKERAEARPGDQQARPEEQPVSTAADSTLVQPADTAPQSPPETPAEAPEDPVKKSTEPEPDSGDVTSRLLKAKRRARSDRDQP